MLEEDDDDDDDVQRVVSFALPGHHEEGSTVSQALVVCQWLLGCSFLSLNKHSEILAPKTDFKPVLKLQIKLYGP